MEKVEKEPTLKRRKNLLISKVANINYDDLYFLYVNDCKLRNISPITIKGYEFAHAKFKDFAGDNLGCEHITQDLINDYILELKDKHKPQTVNSYMFKISPDYQRLFRWDDEKQSRFIESLILEMPVPPIFVIEIKNGVYELIDGLQRISSYLHFRGERLGKTEEEFLSLKGCDIVSEQDKLIN